MKPALFLNGFIAIATGCLQGLSIAWPWSGQAFAVLQILSLFIFLLSVNRHSSIQIKATLAWLFACAWLCSSFWWLYISMRVYGGMPLLLAVFCVFLLAGALSIYYAGAMVLASWLQQKTNASMAALLFAFPTCWTLAELARDQWFTGFPWGAGGYAHIDGLLSGLAPWGGVYVIGWASAFVAQALCLLLIKAWKDKKVIWQWASIGASVATLLILQIKPDHTFELNRLPIQSVQLVQGQVLQNEKFSTQREAAYKWYLNELKNSYAQLTILPETALPYFESQLLPDLWKSMFDEIQGTNKLWIMGLISGTEKGYTNTAIGVRDAPEKLRYNKQHLVPFGEFSPNFFKWFALYLKIPLSNFSRGEGDIKNWEWGQQRLAINICYEDVFGDELARRFVLKDQLPPTAMVNMSNIAWFGNTVAIDQHQHISRMRSLELQRPMLRATNTGATVVIDAYGQVTHHLPYDAKASLLAEFEGVDAKPSFFAYWAGHWGLWPLWGLGLMGLLALWAQSRYRTQSFS
ncbi:MAG: apolipoprotein N-acyltransferase [Limnohabitans sp.]|nr:apolipoprotein N-acyltransferase [Limnohabitans sp.]